MSSKADESKDTVWVVIGAGVALVLGIRWGVPKVHAWWGDGGDELVASWSWLGLVALGLGVVGLVSRWWFRRRSRRRHEVANVLAARLAAVMPTSWKPPVHLQIRRWTKLVPTKVVVILPAQCPTEDVQWRQEVIRAAREVMGVVRPVRWPTLTGRGRRQIVLVTRKGDIPDEGVSDPGAMENIITTALTGIVPSPAVQVKDLDNEIVVGFGETTRDQSPAWRERVVEQVNARTGQRWRADWNRRERQLVLHSVPELPAMLRWDKTAAKVQQLHPGNVIAPYGIDEDGRWVVWEIGNRQPHTLVVGETGTGKTQALKSMMMSALAAGCLIAILDPKLGKDYAEFLGKPGVVALAGSIEDLAAALLDLNDEMKRRLAAHSLAEVLDQNPELAEQMALPPAAAVDAVPLIVFVDETTQMVTDMTQWWSQLDKEEKSERWGSSARQPPMASIPAQFAQLARSIKMHLVIGVQRGDAKNFGDSTQMRDNLPHRVSMGQTSPISSDMVWNDRATGSRVEIASEGEGMSNGTRILEDGTVQRLQHPTRFKSMFTADSARDPAFWELVAEQVPDASLVALPRVSAAAKDPAAAAAALFHRAYGMAPTMRSEKDGDTASITVLPPPTPQPGPFESADATVPLTQPGHQPDSADDAGEVDDAGREWAQVRVTELGVGDVILMDLDEVVVEDVGGWMDDEFSGDQVFRLEVDGADGSQVIDLSDEDMFWRAA